MGFTYKKHDNIYEHHITEQRHERKTKEMKRFVRILYDKLPLRWPNGEEWMSVDDLQQMWKDVLVDEKRYLNVVCPC